MSQPEILDLDKLVPDKRAIRLAGEEIDVSKVPTRVMLEVAKKKDDFQSGGDEAFDLMLDLVAKICKPSKPDISTDWIVDNTSMEQLLALLEFVLKPLQDRANKAQVGKNAVSPNP